jgi:hypothetical protein
MTDALGLTDEEFLAKDPNEFLAEESDQITETVEDSAVDKETNTSDQTDDSEEASQEEVSEAQEQTEVEPTEDRVSHPFGDTQTEPETSTDSKTTESLDTSKQDSTDTKGDTPETTEFDYESAFKKVTAPFKANGVDMQVKDPDDVVRLMQMGANYQKKMSQLKPNLKLIKMLENNELLDEAKLNNLIDLSKKDPTAIAKLVKESTVDPLDIDKDVPTEYQPTNYSVTDTEYDLDAVLDEIKDTDTFTRTINTLTKEWDVDSRNRISKQPEIISIINEHMANGIFDKVNTVLQQEKTLGKLVGISDVDAYRQVAEHLNNQGMFNTQEKSSQVSSKSEPKQADVDRDKKRKAAAPVKQVTSKKAPPENEFLGLSDDEFMKKYA